LAKAALNWDMKPSLKLQVRKRLDLRRIAVYNY
jgi:hypothetical protein